MFQTATSAIQSDQYFARKLMWWTQYREWSFKRLNTKKLVIKQLAMFCIHYLEKNILYWILSHKRPLNQVSYPNKEQVFYHILVFVPHNRTIHVPSNTVVLTVSCTILGIYMGAISFWTLKHFRIVVLAEGDAPTIQYNLIFPNMRLVSNTLVYSLGLCWLGISNFHCKGIWCN